MRSQPTYNEAREARVACLIRRREIWKELQDEQIDHRITKILLQDSEDFKNAYKALLP